MEMCPWSKSRQIRGSSSSSYVGEQEILQEDDTRNCDQMSSTRMVYGSHKASWKCVRGRSPDKLEGRARAHTLVNKKSCRKMILETVIKCRAPEWYMGATRHHGNVSVVEVQ